MFNIFRHRHKWETTHTNSWLHPTKQKCKKCGETRSMTFIDRSKGISEKNLIWVDSLGKNYEYSVLD